MNVVVNGEPKEVNDSITISELLTLLEIDGKIAVELNQEILPKNMHSSTKLRSNDQIEIVNAIGGG